MAPIYTRPFEVLRLLANFFVLVGALNWGTYGILGVDVIASIFGKSGIATAFYALIAFSGLFIILLRVMFMG